MKRFSFLTMLMALLGFILLLGTNSSVTASYNALQVRSLNAIPVRGEVSSVKFTGKMAVNSFLEANNSLAASVEINGKNLNSKGNTTNNTMSVSYASVPVSAQASCNTLNLTFGPVNENIQVPIVAYSMSLKMDRVQVRLESGRDATLKSLFCTVERQIKVKASWQDIAATLNQVIEALDEAEQAMAPQQRAQLCNFGSATCCVKTSEQQHLSPSDTAKVPPFGTVGCMGTKLTNAVV